MKIIQSSLFRAICAIAIGVLLFMHPDKVVESIVIVIGIIFIVSGIISCLAYLLYRNKRKKQLIVDNKNNEILGNDPAFPIVGIGSAVLGFVLALKSETFIEYLMYILGAIVLIAGISQIYALIKARTYFKAHFILWFIPVLLLLSGLYIIIRPFEIAVAPVLIIGVTLVIYGFSEIINFIIIGKKRRDYIKNTNSPELETKE